jgi:hypothetical protein
MADEWDVIVAGAGHNGLACAGYARCGAGATTPSNAAGAICEDLAIEQWWGEVYA